MNKEELLEKLTKLYNECEEEKESAKSDLDKMFLIGKQNGVLWAKAFIMSCEDLMK